MAAQRVLAQHVPQLRVVVAEVIGVRAGAAEDDPAHAVEVVVADPVAPDELAESLQRGHRERLVGREPPRDFQKPNMARRSRAETSGRAGRTYAVRRMDTSGRRT